MSNIIDKIRKLRALAESSNLNEAAAAAAAAERLIQEHNLNEAELLVDRDSEEERVTYDAAAELGSTIPTWQSGLLSALSKAYQCSGFFKTIDWITPKRTNRYVAYGRKSDLDTLRYQYAFFTAEITRLCEAAGAGKGRTFRNSFRLGAVRAISDALFYARKNARAAATSSALVVVDQRAELAKQQRDRDVPNLRNISSSGSRLDHGAYAAGMKAGAGIQQRSQIAASGLRMLKGGKS